MMDVVLSALGVTASNVDKLTFADAMEIVFDLPDPRELWFGSDAPPAAPSPPPFTPLPPNTVGSTSSDADDD